MMNSVQVYENSGNLLMRFNFQLDRKYYFRYRCGRNEPLGRTLDRMSTFFKKMLDVESMYRRSSNILLSESKRVYGTSSRRANEEEQAQVGVIDSDVTFKLLDLSNQEVALETKALEAWRENFKLHATASKQYPVQVNMPHVKSVDLLSRTLMVSMPAVVTIETDKYLPSCDGHFKFFKYMWYYSRRKYDNPASVFFRQQSTQKRLRDDDTVDETNDRPDNDDVEDARNEWILFEQGVNRRVCHLDQKVMNRLIKCVCIPSDGRRDGVPIGAVSTQAVQPQIDVRSLPMTQRHELCQDYLTGNM